MGVEEKIPEITRRIVEASRPEKIILFGSHALGEAGPDSDLDFLVVMRKVAHLRAESTRLRGILRGLLVPIDIIVATSEQMERLGGIRGMVYHEAITKGKVIYERG